MADKRNLSVVSASGQRRKSVRDTSVTSILPGGDIPYDPNHEYDADEEVLAALGYKPEFKREFSLFTTFCVSFAVLGLLPSFASTLYYGMGYAGTGGNFSTLPSWMLRLYANLCNLRNGLGLDHCHGWNTVCRYEYGRTLLQHAYFGRTLLCCCRPRATRLGTTCCLDYGLVKLDGADHRCTICQLWNLSHDTCRGVN